METTGNDGVPLSVVILSYNRREDLAESLERIHGLPFRDREIIVVDNASTDGTPEMIRRCFPSVRLIPLSENLGVEGYNRGFAAARGEIVLILDDDSFPVGHALKDICREFHRHPRMGILALNVRNYYDYDGPQGRGKAPGETAPLKETRLAFNGAGAAIRGRILEEVGGYPGEFFLYWNEQDLALRVLNAGYEIYWYPGIVSLHKYSPRNRSSRRAPFYYTRNLFWLIWKHFYPAKCLKDSIRLLFMVFYYSLEQRTTVYLQAFWSALVNCGTIRRRPVQKKIARGLRLTYRIPFVYY